MHRKWMMLVAAAVFLLAVPAATANNTNGPTTTGTQLFVFAPYPQVFPANTPFYIRHGWSTALEEPTSNWGQVMSDPQTKDVMSGHTHFDLYVDGQKMASTTDLDFYKEQGYL